MTSSRRADFKLADADLFHLFHPLQHFDHGLRRPCRGKKRNASTMDKVNCLGRGGSLFSVTPSFFRASNPSSVSSHADQESTMFQSASCSFVPSGSTEQLSASIFIQRFSKSWYFGGSGCYCPCCCSVLPRRQVTNRLSKGSVYHCRHYSLVCEQFSRVACCLFECG